MQPKLIRKQKSQVLLKIFLLAFLILFGYNILIFTHPSSQKGKKNETASKNNGNWHTHTVCEDCALFHHSSDYVNKRNKKCKWTKSKNQRFCSSKDVGPYLVVAPLWYGLHNNWLHIMSAMFFAQAWGKSGGTVAITGISASRKNFSRETRDKYFPVHTNDLFDIDHTIEYMRNRFNVNICMVKEDMMLETGTPDQALKEIKRFGSKTGETVELGFDIIEEEGIHADEILRMIPESGELTLYSNWQWGWGGKYRKSPPDLQDIQDLHITQKRESALAMCYSANIRELSSRSRSFLRKTFRYKNIVGLHIRLEGDAHREVLSYKNISEFLEPYENQIEKYKLWSPYNVYFYVAHGSLENHVEKSLIRWFHDRNYDFIRKEDTFRGKHLRRLRKMTPDAQAGVDAETLVHLDHFIGYGGSTLSHVVMERRRYFGRSATMSADYDSPPIFVPKKSALWT